MELEHAQWGAVAQLAAAIQAGADSGRGGVGAGGLAHPAHRYLGPGHPGPGGRGGVLLGGRAGAAAGPGHLPHPRGGGRHGAPLPGPGGGAGAG
ncbi:hypothetical protein B5F98_00760 [Pseudoflavonifractor sp. An44]|nr:hypothetical protein B5F98_00760 [Pseudoflavonifractor sp. An44]